MPDTLTRRDLRKGQRHEQNVQDETLDLHRQSAMMDMLKSLYGIQQQESLAPEQLRSLSAENALKEYGLTEAQDLGPEKRAEIEAQTKYWTGRGGREEADAADAQKNHAADRARQVLGSLQYSGFNPEEQRTISTQAYHDLGYDLPPAPVVKPPHGDYSKDKLTFSNPMEPTPDRAFAPNPTVSGISQEDWLRLPGASDVLSHPGYPTDMYAEIMQRKQNPRLLAQR